MRPPTAFALSQLLSGIVVGNLMLASSSLVSSVSPVPVHYAWMIAAAAALGPLFLSFTDKPNGLVKAACVTAVVSAALYTVFILVATTVSGLGSWVTIVSFQLVQRLLLFGLVNSMVVVISLAVSYAAGVKPRYKV